VAGDWAGTVGEDLAADVRRVVERLRTLSQAQLAAPAPPHPSRAAGARAVAQDLATAAQGIEDRASPDEPRWRTLPELADLAVGDQVAVTGHDLLALLRTPRSPGDHAVVGSLVDPAETVWAPGSRRTAGEVVADAAARLATLRRLL
jgi:hypothetical protein